jgi:hypothetical protein
MALGWVAPGLLEAIVFLTVDKIWKLDKWSPKVQTHDIASILGLEKSVMPRKILLNAHMMLVLNWNNETLIYMRML